MLASELLELGLGESEAKVYVATLELGGSYVSQIAKKAGVNRVACYHTLDNLVKMGLISSFTKDNLKYYTVESPQLLVERQRDQLKKAEKLLPELLSITNTLVYKPKIQYYEGLQGIKTIFEDTLTAEDELLGYTNLAKLPDVITAEFTRDYARRKISKGIKTRMLSPYSEEALQYLQNYYPTGFDPNLVEILYVNPKQFMFEYEMNIYNQKVSIVSLKATEMIGLILESPVYAQTQKSIFNLAWLGATSFVAR
jgi:sugar-specific transcriptional regulator TrmB